MIAKGGKWVALDKVEHDETLTGTGTPDNKLGIADPWKKILSDINDIPKDNETYGIQDGKWVQINSSIAKIDIKNSKTTHIVETTSETGEAVKQVETNFIVDNPEFDDGSINLDIVKENK